MFFRKAILILVLMVLFASGVTCEAKAVPDYPPAGPAYATGHQFPQSIYIPYGVNGVTFFPMPKRYLEESYHGTKSLQDFYFKLLLDDFDDNKIAKKYSKLLSSMIKNDIDTLASGRFANEPYHGWQIFLGNGMKAGSYCNVQYLGEQWYAANMPDVENSAVYIKMEKVGKRGRLVITQIRNCSLGIELSPPEE